MTARLAFRQRPDVAITTGAGIVFFFVMWARFVGAKVVLMETLAGVERPSRFGRLAAPLANLMIVQSASIGSAWPAAVVFDPLRLLDGGDCVKEPRIFVTVGATFPFDRLISMMAHLKAQGCIQSAWSSRAARGGAVPRGVESYKSLTCEQIQEQLRRALPSSAMRAPAPW